MSMKRVLAGILTALLTISLCGVTAFAAGPGGGRHFVDTDGDGVCDNAGSQCVYVDADGDGVCDNANNQCVYVDADGDGVCDRCGAIHAQPGGGGFVDADGDGVCDHYQSGQGCGRGARTGGHRSGRNR